jgi:Tetratricopeptide repeat
VATSAVRDWRFAVGWLRDRLSRRTAASPRWRPFAVESGGLCDSCNASLPSGDGYLLTTRDVVQSEKYWASVFARAQRVATSLEIDDAADSTVFLNMVSHAAGQRSAWGICEKCSEFFVFDRGGARSYARLSMKPVGTGAVDLSDCILYAALGWRYVHGTWPPMVEVPAVIDSCDLCGKSIYVGERTSFMPKETLEQHRAEGIVDHVPTREPRAQRRKAGWAICMRCASQVQARLDRALARRGSTSADEITAQLDALIDHVKTDDAARRQFVELLEVLGPDDRRTAAYRRKLAARLY